MIPKKIHYCWFGNGALPVLETKCLNSWKRNLPDYELVLWNEKNFDVNINLFVKEAYEAKKYAFVSDYVRIYALYNQGGIYLDTDVEVIKPIGVFLEHNLFFGLEKTDSIQTGLIGSIAENPVLKKILTHYDNQKFVMNDGKMNMIPNTQLVTDMLTKDYGFVPDNSYQNLLNTISIYPIDYFCGKDWQTGRSVISVNTYTIHHFSGSWYSNTNKFKKKVKRILGVRLTEYAINLKNKVKNN